VLVVTAFVVAAKVIGRSLSYMSEGSRGRDLNETARALTNWLRERLQNNSVRVDDLAIPKAGFSNETVLFTAGWSANGREHTRSAVARIQPTKHQLFTVPDALRQAAVMQTLAPHVPVPNVWLTEADPRVLGAPFFLMDRVHGRVPSDVPSWHRKGWTTALDAPELTLLHDNALRSLVALHSIGLDESVAFLFPRPEAVLDSDAIVLDSEAMFTAFLGDVRNMYEWCDPVINHGSETIHAAMTHVEMHRPRQRHASIVWYDARVGNIMFTDTHEVAALMDWEGATVGPLEFDVAWWVMFDEYLCEAQGFTRLAGIPDRTQTFERYEELGGRPLEHMAYYQVLSGLVLALINSRLVDLLVRNEVVSPDYGQELVTRITNMTARHL
jgi:aminoglycoside phosphotransferase (APT) family kinase protein